MLVISCCEYFLISVKLRFLMVWDRVEMWRTEHYLFTTCSLFVHLDLFIKKHKNGRSVYFGCAYFNFSRSARSHSMSRPVYADSVISWDLCPTIALIALSSLPAFFALITKVFRGSCGRCSGFNLRIAISFSNLMEYLSYVIFQEPVWVWPLSLNRAYMRLWWKLWWLSWGRVKEPQKCAYVCGTW